MATGQYASFSKQENHLFSSTDSIPSLCKFRALTDYLSFCLGISGYNYPKGKSCAAKMIT